MSEFYCFNNHSMPVGVLECPTCGAAIACVDGMSREEAEDSEDWYEEEEDG